MPLWRVFLLPSPFQFRFGVCWRAARSPRHGDAAMPRLPRMRSAATYPFRRAPSSPVLVPAIHACTCCRTVLLLQLYRWILLPSGAAWVLVLASASCYVARVRRTTILLPVLCSRRVLYLLLHFGRCRLHSGFCSGLLTCCAGLHCIYCLLAFACCFSILETKLLLRQHVSCLPSCIAAVLCHRTVRDACSHWVLLRCLKEAGGALLLSAAVR